MLLTQYHTIKCYSY